MLLAADVLLDGPLECLLVIVMISSKTPYGICLCTLWLVIWTATNAIWAIYKERHKAFAGPSLSLHRHTLGRLTCRAGNSSGNWSITPLSRAKVPVNTLCSQLL